MTERRSFHVAIIGGGVMGCSIASHLARLGVSDTVVIERATVGSGASALSAGLVSRVRKDRRIGAMVGTTLQDIEWLTGELGLTVGWHRSGSLRLANRSETVSSLERIAQCLLRDGVDHDWLDAQNVREKVPWFKGAEPMASLYLSGDGYVDGYQLANAYASAARAGGCSIMAQTQAERPRLQNAAVVGLETDRGSIHCDWLIDAAGVWAGQVLKWFGVEFGATALRSHYWVTQPSSPPVPQHPFVVLPDAQAYLRPETGGLLLGIQETASRHYNHLEVAKVMTDLALSDETDWDLLAYHEPPLGHYVAGFESLKFRHHTVGLTSYTPDGHFLIGAIPSVDRLLLASGCCGTGVSSAGGIGRMVAEMVIGKSTTIDSASFDPNRFQHARPGSDAFIAKCVQARASKGRQS